MSVHGVVCGFEGRWRKVSGDLGEFWTNWCFSPEHHASALVFVIRL